MSFWTWFAIALVLTVSVIASTSQKKTERKQVLFLAGFLILACLFLIWWFTR